MTSAYEEIAGHDAEVLAISLDNIDDAGQMVRELGIPFPVLSDTAGTVPKAYMVYNLLGDRLAAPATFVIDKQGVIRWKHVGRAAGDRPSADEILARLADLGA